MQNLPVVSLNDVVHNRIQSESLIRYSTTNEFANFAKELGLMSDLKVSINSYLMSKIN